MQIYHARKADTVIPAVAAMTNFDITIGNGFSTLNPTFLPSSQSGRISHGNWRKHMNTALNVVATARGPEFQFISIYAVHELAELPPPGDKVAQLPSSAELGRVVALIPSMQRFQYQWNGRFYSWVPVE